MGRGQGGTVSTPPPWERAEWDAQGCAYLRPAEALSYPSGSLLAMAGPAGVGKSTWADRLLDGPALVLSSDRMRKRVSGSEEDMEASDAAFSLVWSEALAALGRGQTVLIDSSGTYPAGEGYPSALESVASTARAAGAQAHLIVLTASREECLDGDASRARHVGEEVIDRMLGQLQELGERIAAREMGEAGFASVIVLDREQARAVREVRLGASRSPRRPPRP